MNYNANRTVLIFSMLTVLIISSCGKKDDRSSLQSKQAIMIMEVKVKGDLQSQVAALTFNTVNAKSELVNIVNDSTGVITAGPFLQNSDFSDHHLITFHSVEKVNSVNVMLAISPKVYATSEDQNLVIAIRIYFDGKLKDDQTFSYSQVSGGVYTTPKDFNYKVMVNQ